MPDDEILNEEQLEEALNQDFFTDSEPEPSEDRGGDGEAQPEGTVDKSAEPNADAPAAPVPNAGDDESKGNAEMAAIQSQLAQLQATLGDLSKAPDQPASASDANAPVDAPQDPTNYSVPDEIVQAIFADDPITAKQGVNALVNGVVGTVMRDVRSVIGPAIKQAQEEMLTQVRATMAQTNVGQQVWEDFYTNFPELNKPEFRPFVEQAARQLAQETGAQNWNADFRNALGARLKQILNTGGGTTTPAPEPAPAPSPHIMDGGTRGGETKPLSELQQEVSELLF